MLFEQSTQLARLSGYFLFRRAPNQQEETMPNRQSSDFVAPQTEYVATNDTCPHCGSTVYHRRGGDEIKPDKRCLECFRPA